MLRVQTQEYIEKLSDAELVEYVRVGVYEPKAIAFAKGEIARRNLGAENVVQLTAVADQNIQERRVLADAEARQPLGRWGRVGAYLLGAIGGAVALAYVVLVSISYPRVVRRQRDFRGFVLWGVVTTLACVVVFLGAFRGRLVWMGVWWSWCYLVGIICIVACPGEADEPSEAVDGGDRQDIPDLISRAVD